METGSKRYVYYNRTQMRSMLVRPRHERTIVGRGGGKTTNIQAPRLKYWATEMPRGVIGLLGSSYMQLFTRILPGIIKGWESLGWKEGRDYWVGGYAPKNSGIDRPFKRPLKSDYLIHTKKSSAICLFSQDKPGMSNGVDLCALAGDEARYLNKARMDDEIIPAIRGEAHIFGHLPCYQGTIFTSDMPHHHSGMWLLEGSRSPESDIEMIYKAQQFVNRKLSKFPDYTETVRRKTTSELRGITSKIDALRARTTMIQVSSSLQNINVLGKDWIEHMLNTLSEDEIARSILSIKRIRGAQCFYSDLNEVRHGYMPKETNHVLSVGFNFTALSNRDCRFDEEMDWPWDRLHIGIDSGGSFNCLVVGIVRDGYIYVINNFYIHHPGKIKDVINAFKEYYVHCPRKKLMFHYDQTSIGTRPESEYNVAEIVINTLRDSHNGKWYVEEHYIRQTPSYQWRFDAFAALLKHEHPDFKGIRFNVLNAEQWYESCIAADVKQVGNKLEKDKSSEKRDASGKYKVPQEKATHLSEAGDMLVSGILKMSTTLVAVNG